MDLIPTAITFGGIALCAMALLQFALWSAQSLSLSSENNKQFELSRELFRKQIQDRSTLAQTKPNQLDGQWSGYRTFRVAKLVKETDGCTSVYLQPEDGKPIAAFLPGQHLTLKFQIAGEPQPVVRCYSLSERPGQNFYRITAKSVLAPHQNPDIPPGRASNFINDSLRENDRIEIKAPSGHFVLDELNTAPIVLLAGGIGVTPMVSMINHLIAADSQRMILLVYGVRNGTEHAFKQHLQELSNDRPQLHVVNCYSNPGPEDREGQDYLIKGFASVDLLKQILPDNRCQFYLCGPPPFMKSIFSGLIEWGVAESQIAFEAFGPASIEKTRQPQTAPPDTNELSVSVSFAASNVAAAWNTGDESLLDLAEANGVSIDSGCRAGSCGTCETGLLKGKVTYPENQSVDCPPGQCLVCIARPDGPVELDA